MDSKESKGLSGRVEQACGVRAIEGLLDLSFPVVYWNA
jgi:hypothetical protein